MLATCRDEFCMKALMFFLLIGMITYFLEGPLVVIWILSLGFEIPLTMLLTWSIFFALRARKVSLILRTSDVLALVLVAWAYDLAGLLLPFLFLLSAKGFLLWKYLEIVFTFFLDLAGRGGRGGFLLMVTGTSFACCYDSRLKGLNQEATLVLSNTRELDRVPKTK